MILIWFRIACHDAELVENMIKDFAPDVFVHRAVYGWNADEFYQFDRPDFTLDMHYRQFVDVPLRVDNLDGENFTGYRVEMVFPLEWGLDDVQYIPFMVSDPQAYMESQVLDGAVIWQLLPYMRLDSMSTLYMKNLMYHSRGHAAVKYVSVSRIKEHYLQACRFDID